MSGTGSEDVPGALDIAEIKASNTLQTMLLHVEKAAVSKRVKRSLVRATRTTSTRDETVNVDLDHEHIIVERIAIGRVVDAVPPIRQEGDVTIVPVVKEELVMVRQLVLKEEVRLRRVHNTTTHSEVVAIREQHVAVTRIALDD